MNAGDGGDVEAVVAIERHAVGATLLALGYVAQLRERALVFDAAVRLHVVGVDGRSQGVIDDEGLAIACQRDAVWPLI